MSKRLLLIAIFLAVVFCNVDINKMFSRVLNGSEPLTEFIAKDMYKLFRSPANPKSHYRYKIFLKNLNRIIKHNSEKHSWKMGINDFADMTKEEIQGSILMEPTKIEVKKEVSSLTKEKEVEKGRRPYVYDWRTYELWT